MTEISNIDVITVPEEEEKRIGQKQYKKEVTGSGFSKTDRRHPSKRSKKCYESKQE